MNLARTAALLLISYLFCTLAINGLALGLSQLNDHLETRYTEVEQ